MDPESFGAQWFCGWAGQSCDQNFSVWESHWKSCSEVNFTSQSYRGRSTRWWRQTTTISNILVSRFDCWLRCGDCFASRRSAASSWWVACESVGWPWVKPARVEKCSGALDGSRLANTWVQDVSGCSISQGLSLCGCRERVFLLRYQTRRGLSRHRNDFWTLVQMTHVMITSQNDTKTLKMVCPWHRNPLLDLLGNVLTSKQSAVLTQAAEKALKRAKVLEERRAAKRASATPMDELEESATNAEVPAESLMITAEAALTETREKIEALSVSALQQAHEMSHRPETTAESFFHEVPVFCGEAGECWLCWMKKWRKRKIHKTKQHFRHNSHKGERQHHCKEAEEGSTTERGKVV